MKRFALIAGLLAMLVGGTLSGIAAPAHAGEVVVNGRALSDRQVAGLASMVGEVRPGRYWYDPVSGLWGPEGGPAKGQIRAGLPAAPLRADASGGGTGVFVNGREIHPLEYQRLDALFGYVQPGRYWLNERLVGGFEGGPPQFDLRRATGRGGGGGWTATIEEYGPGTDTIIGHDSDGCFGVSSDEYSYYSC